VSARKIEWLLAACYGVSLSVPFRNGRPGSSGRPCGLGLPSLQREGGFLQS
jgi:hypothetical protein